MRTWTITVLAALVVGASAPKPAAELRYLQHSAWLLKTAAHELVFDYVESLPSGAQLPSELRLTADSFDGRRTFVFVSHAHADHFFPGIAAWPRERPGIQFVAGWAGSGLPDAKVVPPHETWSSDGLTVTAIRATDEGAGFLVSVDGLGILHAGDHARWSDGDDEAFMREIAWLKSQGKPIDIALFPVATGASCDPRPSIWQGVRVAAQALAPRVLMPMHVACPDRLDVYDRFRAETSKDLPRTQVVAPARLGQTFRYQTGRMSVE